MKTPSPAPAPRFVRPKGFLAFLLGGMFLVWLTFAILLNWAKVGDKVYAALVVDVDAVLRGEVWRFFTAPFIHGVYGQPGVFHILVNSLLLYSFGRHLQEAWGSRRLASVLLSAALLAELFQLAAVWVLPPIGQRVFFGSYAMSFAAIAAYGFSNRDLVVSFWLVPMRAVTLVYVSLGFYLLVAIAAGRISEGLLAPFVGAFVGYLLGGGTPSPVRRFFLKRKLAELEAEPKKARPSYLRLIDNDEEGPVPPRGGGDAKKGSDKKEWLN